MIPVKSGSKYGYVDKEGSFLINPQFDRATFFWEGLASVASGGLCGYIDTKGNYVIPPTYRDVTTFTEGIAWTVKKEGAPIAIDKKGEVLFALKEAERVYSFSEGMARYRIVSPYDEKEYLYGFVNTKGETVVLPIYSDASNFAEGVAAVANEKGEYGYINKAGELTINYQFEHATPFHKGRAIVCSNNIYGTINKDGQYVINPQFGYMIQDGENYVIQLQDGRQWGWCDKKGKIIINPQFDAVEMFGENDLAPVRIEQKIGFINRNGIIAINPQFSNAAPFFDNNYALVGVNDKWGAVDKDGKFIFNPQFSDIGSRSNASVISDYFNLDAIMTNIQELITQNKIDNKIDFATPLSRVMSEYGLDENAINRNKGSFKLKETTLSRDAVITLFMSGEFYNKISDGWWGYNYVLNKKAIPSKYQLTIKLKNKGEGKEDAVVSHLLNYFKTRGRDLEKQQSTVEFSYGNYNLKISQERNKVLIMITAAEPGDVFFQKGVMEVPENGFVGQAPETVAVGEQFRLQYIIGSQKNRDFQIPPIPDFEILMGPSLSQQSSTKVTNGKTLTKQRAIFTYVLAAIKEGTFTIPGATILIEGKKYTSNSVTVIVTPQK